MYNLVICMQIKGHFYWFNHVLSIHPHTVNNITNTLFITRFRSGLAKLTYSSIWMCYMHTQSSSSCLQWQILPLQRVAGQTQRAEGDRKSFLAQLLSNSSQQLNHLHWNIQHPVLTCLISNKCFLPLCVNVFKVVFWSCFSKN